MDEDYKEVRHIYDQPKAKFKFIQYAKDVGWEISFSGDDIGMLIIEVLDHHEQLRKMFKEKSISEP